MVGKYKSKALFSLCFIALLLSGVVILQPSKASMQDFASLQVQYHPGEPNEGPTFLLSSYNHDVNLSKIDFSHIAYIQLNDKQLIPAHSWRLLQSGHHLQGRLYFQPLPISSESEVKLIIKTRKTEEHVLFKSP